MEEEKVVINSKEYWDMRYKKEVDDKFTRADPVRWQLVLSQIKEKDRVLEFGSGLGEFIFWIAAERPLCSFTGIDISEYAINKCKELMPNFNWYVGDSLHSIPEQPQFDVIVCQHTWEHLTEEDQKKFMEQAEISLKKDGKLVMVVPMNDAEWYEHPKIYTLEDMRKLVRESKPKWESVMMWRPFTNYKRADNHNDGDFEEAIIFMRKR